MWAVRGAQSAVYYYAACTPCLICMSERKRKKQNKLDRLERQAWERDIPNLYRHPSPAGRNPNWDEDRLMGPNHTPKNKKKKAKNGKDKSKVDEKQANESPDVTPEKGDSIAERSTPELSTVDGVKNAIRQAAIRRTSSGERWNRKRYEREDEELWEFDYRNPPPDADQSLQAKLSPTLHSYPSLNGADTDGTSTETFYNHRTLNPDLSELHPPVVFHPMHSKSGSRWMLQPPPSPAVMNGYEKANRSRSGSGHSGRKAHDIGEMRLQRKISARVIQSKVLDCDPMDLPDLSDLPRKGSVDRSSFGSRGRARSSPKHNASDETTGTVVRHSPNKFSSAIPNRSVEVLALPLPVHIADGIFPPEPKTHDFASTYGRLVSSPEPPLTRPSRALTAPRSMKQDLQGLGPLQSSDAEAPAGRVEKVPATSSEKSRVKRPFVALKRTTLAKIRNTSTPDDADDEGEEAMDDNENAIAEDDDEDNDAEDNADAYQRYNEFIDTPNGNFKVSHVHDHKPRELSPNDKFWGWGGRRWSVEF